MAEFKVSKNGKPKGATSTKGTTSFPHPNQKRHSKKPPLPSPEEQAKIQAALEAEKKAALAESERVQKWGESLPKMTFRQLNGAIRRFIPRPRKRGEEPKSVAGLINVAEAICLNIVLNDTKTKENPFAKLSTYVR